MCVCVYICIYMYVYITSAYMYMSRLCSSQSGLQWHVAFCIHSNTVILVYRCDKQTSNVILSIQFDTNVSQLVRRVLPWSCAPLTSLSELSSSSLNRLSVSCLSYMYCASTASKWSWFHKMGKAIWGFSPCFSLFFPLFRCSHPRTKIILLTFVSVSDFRCSFYFEQ